MDIKEKTIESALFLVMKFGKKENLEALRRGTVYMKNLQYYIDLEKSTDDGDVGDMFDGLMPIRHVKLSNFATETNELITQFSSRNLTFNLGYCKCPVFCMFILDYRNHTEETLIADVLTVRYDFSEEQRQKLRSFGDYVLIINNPDEFFARLKKGFLDAGVSFSRDYVKYYDGNTIQHMQDVQKYNSRIAFWKRSKYSYQQEYRILAFEAEVDDFLSVDIGDISDISYIESSESILGTFIEAEFTVTMRRQTVSESPQQQGKTDASVYETKRKSFWQP